MILPIKMKISRKVLAIAAIPIASVALASFIIIRITSKPESSAGRKVDELNGVAVYYNGSVDNVSGRNVTRDGYNLGLKYQCVEFVKRYYYEHLDHRMPDSYGHAKDFFDEAIGDGEWNSRRALFQFTNGSRSRPSPDDLIVFGPTAFNPYGHVAIISKVSDSDIEIVQQNPGPLASSRDRFSIEQRDGRWFIRNSRALGWLRKQEAGRNQ
ncbi:MAG: CHAP domain-containing protein [Acidobacteriota bacterium]